MTNQTKLAVVLHADVVGSTGLVQVDERSAHDSIRAAFQRLSESVRAFRGVTRELRGDALVADFERASDAVLTAVHFQFERGSEEYSATTIDLRIGIAMGEVVVADGTITGTGVVIAQRIEQLTPPGQVGIQGAIYDVLPGRLPFMYTDLGENDLKGFNYPIRVYTVSLRSGENLPAPPAEAKTRSETPTQPELSHRPSITVLPFELHSNDPDDAFLRDGLVEDLVTALSSLRWLLVVSRASAEAMSKETHDLQELGARLDVRFVVTGSVRRSGSRVRVTAALSDSETGETRWSKRYDRVVDDIFDLQDELTRQLAAQLGLELTTQDLEALGRLEPDNIDGWAAYQRGVALLSRGEIDDACECFTRATELDPGFAPARSAYAYALWHDLAHARTILGDAPGRMEEILRSADSALRLDPQDSTAHIVRALVHMMRKEFELALKEVNEGLELSGSSVLGLVIRGTIKHLGGFSNEDALADFELADRLAPSDSLGGRMRLPVSASVNLALGRDEEAAALGERAWRAGSFWGPFTAAAAYWRMGQSGRARELIQEKLAERPEVNTEFLRNWLSSYTAHDDDYVAEFINTLEAAGLPGAPDC